MGPIASRVAASLAIVLLVATQPAATALASPGPDPKPTTWHSFNAPIFGTTGTLTVGRMPTIDQVRCSDATCTTGVLPSAAQVDAIRYLSKTVANGGTFSKEPGFLAKVNYSWWYGSGGKTTDEASFYLFLAQFSAGTSFPDVVARDAANFEITLDAPTTNGDITSWSGLATLDASTQYRVVYVNQGDALVRAACLYSTSLASAGVCNPVNVGALAVQTLARPAPSSLPNGAAVNRLIPPTPAGLRPALVASDDSPLIWSYYAPSSAMMKSLAGTRTAVLQYRVQSAPGLLFTIKLAPVENASTKAFVNTICDFPPASEVRCEKKAIGGAVTGYTGTLSSMRAPSDVRMVTTQFTGGGRVGAGTCELTNSTTMSTRQQSVCRTSLSAIATAAVKG